MSNIEWTDKSWNPIRGCTAVSPGCENCYAQRQAHRFSGPGKAYEGLTRLTAHGPKWTGKIRLVPEKLDEPLRWRKPRRIFVNSMSDLFHEDVPFSYIYTCFKVMRDSPRHTFQVLTKRPQRMRDFFDGCRNSAWPLPNVWLGVSAENQATADERIPLLLETPAAVRFVSAEPLLGPIDFARNGLWLCEHWKTGDRGNWWWEPQSLRGPGQVMLDQIIIGGESGPSARPCDVDWIRSIKDQCAAASVACFVKQLGAHVTTDHQADNSPVWEAGGRIFTKHSKGGDPDEWPEDLRVRQFPGE